MAQQTTVRFVDDLDGSDASGTFDFSLDGRQYQIDLSDENAAKLRDALASIFHRGNGCGPELQLCNFDHGLPVRG